MPLRDGKIVRQFDVQARVRPHRGLQRTIDVVTRNMEAAGAVQA